MEIYNIFPGSYASNCYVLIADGKDGKRHAAVVDPSASAQRIITLIEEKGAKLEYIVLTHGHFDHIMALDALRDRAAIPAYIHEGDAEMLPDGEKNAYSFFFGEDKQYKPAEKTLKGGDVLRLGDEELEVISTPGHSKGSICLLNKKDKFLITGDTIFAAGYGRYDLYGGDPRVLSNSLRSLSDLDGDLLIYPGHGERETLRRAIKNLYGF